MSQRFARARRKEALLAYAFLFPSFLFLATFTYWPIIRSFWFSLHDVVLGDPEIFWMGAENYMRVLDDALFWKVLANTAFYTLTTIPISILAALLLAVALDRKLRGMAIYRSAFFYPVMIPSVAAGMVWVFLYAPGYGPINAALGAIGLPHLDWLYDSDLALSAIVIMSAWKYSGYFMLILLAALKLVPSDLYEAARLDGVSGVQRLLHITIPLISPTLYFVVVIGILHSYQVFDYVYVMTQGGPADSTNVLTYYIYQNGFQYQDIGYASTVANTLLVFMLGLIGLVALTLGRRVHYLGEK
ncbi:carbohydrate ABC transporter membrane protein 1 (CUT1 family) [Breoghania corrubedonensis]|uniref:Carbohydrate ABC transporter membrane protein 1 (CUT1 family) n=1 Tax=Breoghania corrubedonensis TaxID=665038 RepID=A0A2T5US77_9HYPH|nr:sugar ABC transporter permease [Breoghania corrubedonensis]PTW54340.1 carbohydrate ABC transporter membrane protein 1 (CUT1 family) [Breoghania corrubedonensis]